MLHDKYINIIIKTINVIKVIIVLFWKREDSMVDGYGESCGDIHSWPHSSFERDGW